MTKEYVGVKLVTAWEQKGTDGREGYAVKSADGYTSWSPKDVFEEAYEEVENLGEIGNGGRVWEFTSCRVVAGLPTAPMSKRP